MVTDSANDGAVGNRDFMDMRRIDDKLAPVGYHWFKLVHAFATHPQLIVHQGRAREHCVEGMLLISNVQPPGQIACLVPGTFGRANKQSSQLRVIHHHTETELGHCYHRGGAIHNFTHRGVFVADDHRVSDHRPEPMKEVEHFWPANPREQVLVTPGTADHFVRKHRANDDDLIVLKDPAINIDGHVHRKQAAAFAFDLGGGNCADVFQP